MTIQDAHTDDYPRDIDIDLMSPEQPPTGHQHMRSYTPEENFDWATQEGPLYKPRSGIESPLVSALRAPEREHKLRNALCEIQREDPQFERLRTAAHKLISVIVFVRDRPGLCDGVEDEAFGVLLDLADQINENSDRILPG